VTTKSSQTVSEGPRRTRSVTSVHPNSTSTLTPPTEHTRRVVIPPDRYGTAIRPEPVEGRVHSCFDKLSTNGIEYGMIVVLPVRRVVRCSETSTESCLRPILALYRTSTGKAGGGKNSGEVSVFFVFRTMREDSMSSFYINTGSMHRRRIQETGRKYTY